MRIKVKNFLFERYQVDPTVIIAEHIPTGIRSSAVGHPDYDEAHIKAVGDVLNKLAEKRGINLLIQI